MQSRARSSYAEPQPLLAMYLLKYMAKIQKNFSPPNFMVKNLYSIIMFSGLSKAIFDRLIYGIWLVHCIALTVSFVVFGRGAAALPEKGKFFHS